MKGRFAIPLLLASALLPSCGGEVTEQAAGTGTGKVLPGANVLLITIDTLRYDYLGCYGNDVVRTPLIDELAAEGALFEFCVAHNPLTLPSHVNILTGTDARTHGVHDNTGFRLRDEALTLPEILRPRGYETAAFVAAFVLDSRFGLEQGFDHYDDYYGINRPGNPFITERPADETVAATLEWLRGRGGRPWFAWVHLFDPHWPHEVPPPFNVGFKHDLYAGEVSYVDYCLKRLFEHLRSKGLLDKTLVVVTSDHGEGLGDHGERTHGIFAYNATLRVPLIIRAPWAIKPGVRIGGRVRHIDILPTILDLVGIEVPAAVRGSTLIDALSGQEEPPRDSYFEALAGTLNWGWAPLRGAFHQQWKYIDLPLPELYDMDADPQESTSRLVGRADVVQVLRRALESMREGASESVTRTRQEDEETLRRLEALGYVSAGAYTEKEEYGAEDDPKRLIALSDMLDESMGAVAAGDFTQARRLLEELIETRPTMSMAYRQLAITLIKEGKPGEAVEVMERAAGAGVRDDGIFKQLAIALTEAGRFTRAAEVLRATLERDPGDLDLQHHLAMALQGDGRTAEAEQVYRRILEADDSFIEARGNYGWLLLDQERDQEAEAQFRAALEQYPRHAASLHGLGLIMERRRDLGEAIRLYQSALESEPTRYAALLQLAVVQTRAQRIGDAIQALELFLAQAPERGFAEERAGARRLLESLRRDFQ